MIIPTPREEVVLLTSDNAYDTSQRRDALVSAGVTLIGAYPGPGVLPDGYVIRKNNTSPSYDPYLQVPVPGNPTAFMRLNGVEPSGPLCA